MRHKGSLESFAKATNATHVDYRELPAVFEPLSPVLEFGEAPISPELELCAAVLERAVLDCDEDWARSIEPGFFSLPSIAEFFGVDADCLRIRVLGHIRARRALKLRLQSARSMRVAA